MKDKYPDNAQTEAMIAATQKMFQKPTIAKPCSLCKTPRFNICKTSPCNCDCHHMVAKYTDEETGAKVSLSIYYMTIEKHYPGSGRHGCVIPIALLDDVASIAARHSKQLRGEGE